jgi:putative transposase
VKYSFITQHKDTYPISLQCQILGVRHQGYYHYRPHTENKPVNPEHKGMLEWIQALAKASDDTHGSRRMKIAMGFLGYPISRSKTRKLLKEADVAVRHRKKYKVTTNSNHKQPVFENLMQRQFEVAQTDQVYAAEVTYIWTQESWL